jgi:hypothetical protein
MTSDNGFPVIVIGANLLAAADPSIDGGFSFRKWNHGEALRGGGRRRISL